MSVELRNSIIVLWLSEVFRMGVLNTLSLESSGVRPENQFGETNNFLFDLLLLTLFKTECLLNAHIYHFIPIRGVRSSMVVMFWRYWFQRLKRSRDTSIIYEP